MFEHVRCVHLVGAGGVGVSAVGKLFLRMGRQVTGSDLHGGLFSYELRAAGATIFPEHTAANVPASCDMVVYSAAVPVDNPERQAAAERGITSYPLAQFLGELAKNFFTIAVTGTHGKSTTTAMIGKVLEAAGLDPTVIVGSRVPGWELGNLRVGDCPGTVPGQSPPILVLEACEHMAHHLKIIPDIGVITNVEFDHPDFYRDVEHVEQTMRAWQENIESRKAGKVVWVEKEPEPNLQLRVPGVYNQRNAAGALAVARCLGVDEALARKTLEAFPGIWRRFEHVGIWKGADVYSDYGHHPTAIAVTLKAARDLFPGRRLVHIFQPHQHARTKELFYEFAGVLGREADVTILVEIYGVAGRTDSRNVSSRSLAEAVTKRVRSDHFIRYAENLDEAERRVREIAKPGDVLFFQGAGDIDDVARRL